MNLIYKVINYKVIIALTIILVSYVMYLKYDSLSEFKKDTEVDKKVSKELSKFSKIEALGIEKEIDDGKIHVDINCSSCYYQLHTKH